MKTTPTLQSKTLGSVRTRRLCANLLSERGQSLVELALLTPILLLLVVGIVEIGRFASLSIQVANAARAGAAYGSQNPADASDSTGITNAALNDGQNISGLTVAPASGASYAICACDNSGTISASGCNSTCSTGHLVESVSVKATGNFNSLFHYPGIPASINVTNTATMRVAQ